MVSVRRPDKAQAGEGYGSFFQNDCMPNTENIESGRILCTTADGKAVRKFCTNIATLTFSADLVAGDKVNMYVTNADGTLTAIAEVTYNTSHSATMTAIGNAITAVNSDLVCTVASRVLTVTMQDKGYFFIATASVNNTGAGTATVATAFSSNVAVYGISPKVEYKRDSSGGIYVPANSTVNVTRKGQRFVYCKGAFSPTSTVYVRVTDGTGDELRGTLRVDNTNAIAGTGLYFKTTGEDEFALVEVNLP